MVPGSFGCGSAVLAATAMLAPSRAARRPIARPMPRDAPVMNSVLPCRVPVIAISPAPRASGFGTRHEGEHGDLRLLRGQALGEDPRLLVDTRLDRCGIAANEPSGQAHRFAWLAGERMRCRQRPRGEGAWFDDGVDDAVGER